MPYSFEAMFQSRNRGSFDFKAKEMTVSARLLLFQSRNRGSFDFKSAFYEGRENNEALSFNLVIEVLLISRVLPAFMAISRLISFNLVIEVLLISSR